MAKYDLYSSRQCNICLMQKSEKPRLDDDDVEESVGETTITKTEETLRVCNGCMLVMYCSREHQRLEWPLHRELCKAIQKIRFSTKMEHAYCVNGEPKTYIMLEASILQMKFLLRMALSRPLQMHEEEISSFPRCCVICLSFNHPRSCRRCLAVSYCSEKHAKVDENYHKRICGLLQLYYCPYKVLPLPKDIISQLHVRVKDMRTTDLYGAFEVCTQTKLPAKPVASLHDYQLFATAADFSCIATICYVLSHMELRSHGTQRFVIFIVGATIECDVWFQEIHTSFFFLQFPKITLLELYFIGPEVVAENEKTERCFTFKGKQRTVVYNNCRVLYQDFCCKNNVRPSLITAFNCGFSEFYNRHNAKRIANELSVTEVPEKQSTWDEGIACMVKSYDVPIIFTSFTSLEADFDYGTVLRIAQDIKPSIVVERIFHICQNPYRDLRPLRNWHHTYSEEIYYRNGFVQGISCKLKEVRVLDSS